ncbi:MAG: Glu-tRNA(Gln) amidotransferase subunit GatE [Candidatus Aminicenantes bacterium]|nr:Glu-tRNA(Gln) amidotransferase subunit GatE [Candidatus Aminicenantes bacterium]
MAYDFVFKPFEKMTLEDYAAVGFKSGLEIHQQLLTDKKLFCRCPAGRYSDVYHAEILRHMRPTLSELGEYDGTALMEFKTKKEIIYRINRETVCTYEMDDTPPFMINEQALDIALGIAMLYRCVMVDELHIARKQYLDGSIPTGFQRTTIVGVDGRIPFGDRDIGIIQLGLEEDACREVSDFGHRRVYKTDRLGMPLIETVTAPDMKTPQEVAAVAQILRRIVRSTGRVRTGMGAGREDVNVSVTGGTRIEIKGVPRIPRIPLLTYNEAMRQWNLLRLREELSRRGITTAAFAASFEDVTKHLRKTKYTPIETALKSGMVVQGVRLNGFRGFLRWQTQTDTYFSQEISDRVRVIACLTVLPNILHSDSPSESLASSEWMAVKKALGARDEDAVVLVWGQEMDACLGAQEIAARAKEATIGVPSETRQALRDDTNGFERILPGPDRMYPDTDLPPKKIGAERLAAIRAGLPSLIQTREKWYREIGVPADVVERLSVSPYAGLFEKVVREWGLSPKTAAVILIQYPKRLKRKGLPPIGKETAVFEEILAALREKRLYREGVLPLLESWLTKNRPVRDLLPSLEGNGNPTAEALRIAESLRGRRFENAPRRMRRAMGLLMAEWRGRIDGAEASRIIAEGLTRVEA